MRPIYLLLLLVPLGLAAQQPLVADHTPLSADYFIGIDKFKNLYYIEEMVLKKTGPLGNFVFRDYQLGPITSVDIINPFNVVVFYEEANMVVFLDNRLNEINRLNFNELDDFIMLKAVRNAGNNQLWAFDINTQQLELYNYRNGRKTLISQPITGEVRQLAGDFNYCYLLTRDSLSKYNIYGSFLWEIPVSNASQVVLSDNRLLLIRENNVDLLDPASGELLRAIDTGLELPEKTGFDLQLNRDFLYLYNGVELRALPLTNPKD